MDGNGDVEFVSGGDGGGYYADSDLASEQLEYATKVEFFENHACGGGALYVRDTPLCIGYRVEFEANSAASGGAVLLQNADPVTNLAVFNRTTWIRNTASASYTR